MVFPSSKLDFFYFDRGTVVFLNLEKEREDERNAKENVQTQNAEKVRDGQPGSTGSDLAQRRNPESGASSKRTEPRSSTSGRTSKSHRSSRSEGRSSKGEKEEGRRRGSKKVQIDNANGGTKRDSKGRPRESTKSKRKSRESDELRELKEKYERKRRSKKGTIDIGDDIQVWV